MKFVINLCSKEAIEMSGSMFLSLVRVLEKEHGAFLSGEKYCPCSRQLFVTLHSFIFLF